MDLNDFNWKASTKSSFRYPHIKGKKPDSLVLIIYLTLCNNCNKEHRSHNSNLLVKFEKIMVNFNGPLSYLTGHNGKPGLKREILIYRRQSVFCESCFNAETIFDDGKYIDNNSTLNKTEDIS